MGKIGDLFVRLGIKNEDFKKGINEAQTDTERFGEKMQSFGKVALGVWAAVTAAVVNFAKDAISMTQKWGDQWSIIMEGVKSAYGVLVRQLSSGEGWNNLFRNMEEAYFKGKEIAAVMDEIFERKISFSYDEAQTRLLISQYQLDLRMAKTDEERAKIAKQIQDEEDGLAERKKLIWSDEAGAMRDKLLTQTKLNNDEIDFLVKNYNTNRDIINEGRAYMEQRTQFEKQMAEAQRGMAKGGVGKMAYAQMWEEARAALVELDKTTSQTVKDVGELTRAYDRSNDALVQGMADADIAVINIDTEANQRQMRAAATLGAIERKASDIGDAAEEATSKLIEMHNAAEGKRAESAASPISALGGISGLPTGVTGGDGAKDLAGQLDYYSKKAEEAKEKQDALNKSIMEAEELNYRLSASISYGISDALQEMTDQLMGVADANPAAIFSALLAPLLDLARREGEILLAQGIGVEAFKKSLETLQGAPAIIAGTALIAISTAASSALRGLASGGSSSAAGTTSTSSIASGVAENMEMTIHIEGKLKGSDIVLAGQRTQAAWGR